MTMSAPFALSRRKAAWPFPAESHANPWARNKLHTASRIPRRPSTSSIAGRGDAACEPRLVDGGCGCGLKSCLCRGKRGCGWMRGLAVGDDDFHSGKVP
jgi:hypothetical protein